MLTFALPNHQAWDATKAILIGYFSLMDQLGIGSASRDVERALA